MPTTATPVYTQSGLVGLTTLTTASSNRDGTAGAFSAVIQAGSNGSLVDYIVFQATVTSAAGLIRVFYSADHATAWQLVAEIATAGVTVSGTVGGEQVRWTTPNGIPFPLPANSGLKFNIANSEAWGVFVIGGNL
jgi:hypothetical protein